MRIPKILLIVLFLAAISLPYLAAARAGGPDYVFNGFLVNPADGNSYLAKMYQGWRGDWQFRLAFTAQESQGAYLFLFYLFLGHLSRVLSLPLVVTFHLARLLSAVVLIIVLDRFLKVTLPASPWRDLSFGLALFGLGMGWMALPFGALTSDFWIVEAYPFLSAYSTPHFALGLALLLWLLTLPEMADGWHGRLADMLAQWPAMLAAFVLGVLAPFGVVAAGAVLAGLLAWSVGKRLVRGQWVLARPRRSTASLLLDEQIVRRVWMIIGRLLALALAGLPVLVYDLWVVGVDPLLAVWNAQNLTPSPPLWDILLSFSPALIFAIVGGWWSARRQMRPPGILVIWALIGLVMLYAPVSLQRRFMIGLYAPLAALAALGLEKLSAERERLGRWLALLLVALSLPTTLLILAIAAFGIQTKDGLLYLSRGEVQALEWIEANTPGRALILAGPEMGGFIPGHSGRRVIYGHPFETVNAAAEEQAVRQFFETAAVSPAAAQQFLAQREVEYVFYGPREQALGALPALDGLREVYQAQGVSIFEVQGGQ